MVKQSPGLWGHTEILSVGYTEVLPMDQRRQLLNQALSTYLNRVHGKVVKVSSDGMLVQYQEKRINHVLHLLLTVFTLGIWLIPWAMMGLSSGKIVHMLVQVDDYGTVVAVPLSAKDFLKDGRP